MNWLVRFMLISRSQWPWMIWAIVLNVAVIGANALLMALSGWFIASMAVAGGNGTAFNYFFPSGGIRFLAIFRTVGRYAERLVSHNATFRILAELRVWLFQRFAPLAPAGLERYAGGDVAGRLRGDVDALETIFLKVLAPLLSGVLCIGAGLAFMCRFSPLSALMLLFFLLLAGLGLPLLVRRLSQEPGRRSAQLAADLRTTVTEGLQGMEELMLLGAVERQAADIDRLSARLLHEQERLGRINGLAMGGMVLCAGLGVVAVLLTGSMEVASRAIAGADLVMLLLFTAAIFEAAGQFPPALQALPAAAESARRIFEMADAPIPVPDRPVMLSRPADHGMLFSNVSAAYLPGQPVLRHLSFAVPAGSSVVLTGPSGIGKSLLIEILLRFRTYEGCITIGGTEIRDLPKDTLLEMFTALPQHPHLFNGTIRENILLGNPGATDEKLSSIIAASGLTSWISTLPLGLETPVGNNGSAVSGGEARRIALARALLKDAPILLLDEPTEGLDVATEREVVASLKQLKREGRTMLVISHRPACVELGEQVVRL